MTLSLAILWFLHCLLHTCCPLLYPRESETREVISLNGVWKFRLAQSSDEDNWILMPVPSSYNDITTNSTIRDYVGWVWYKRMFFVPKQWGQDAVKVYIRFGSVHYICNVFINGDLVAAHEGGHLPFQVEVTKFLLYGSKNTLSVSVNNTLTQDTLPQGSVEHMNDTDRYPEDYIKYSMNCDYFNYAGIHRNVYLYTVPQIHITDVTVLTSINDTTGIIQYEVSHNSKLDNVSTHIEIFDENIKVAECKGLCGTVYIPEAKFWWPYLSHPAPGYLYIVKVSLIYNNSAADVYRLPVGIRSLEWNETSLLLNNRPLYIKGFGKHEDASIRGRGIDDSTLLRDYQLMLWLGANSYRTSHYPYSEEALNLADKLGIMIIGETAACGLNNFHESLLLRHHVYIKDMISRDKNHPSVIMWSLANEPHTDKNESESYFSSIVQFTREIDESRPITFVTSQQVHTDKAVKFVDIVCVNRYRAWYSDPGHLELILFQVTEELKSWHSHFHKPVLITEYGAGSLAGLHTLPSSMWTEDYQVSLLHKHFKVFDTLRSDGFLLGEMIWNFQDFVTPQEITRPGACSKGLFTRNRQPKAAAHVVRARYWNLEHNITNVPLKLQQTSCSL